jgi:deoxyribodipyrimidine photolyase-related protein
MTGQPSTLFLFPNQLFSIEVLTSLPTKPKTIVFIEHPLFYGKRRGSGAVGSLALNRVRLAYMAVCHRRYRAMLEAHPHWKVRWVPYREVAGFQWPERPASAEMAAYIDPCDHLLESWLKKTVGTLRRYDSPSFLLTRDQLDSVPGTGRLSHGPFYEYVKETRGDLKGLKALMDTPNLDRENRKPYRATGMPQAPEVYKDQYSAPEEWARAREWIDANGFAKNPGPLMAWEDWVRDYAVYLPVEREHALRWMEGFFKERFQHYGPYQDVVLYENPMMFHSGLSVFLNNGFLTPDEVIERAYRVAGKSKKLRSSYEGFIRQVSGWREYARLYYVRVPAKVYKKNVFGLKGRLGAEWYKGTTGVEPLDKTIQWAMNYGYINHIQRLMVVSNAMTLMEKSPDQLYRWMFEFSLDSYEWVMVFNCYSMGSWGDAGVAMRKPYISSANYLQQMTNLRTGDWVAEWNRLYWTFMDRHSDVLKHTQAWRRPAGVPKEKE